MFFFHTLFSSLLCNIKTWLFRNIYYHFFVFGGVSGNRVFATRQKGSFSSWAISKSPLGLRWGLIPSMHPHTRDCNLHILDNPKIISRMKCHPGRGRHWTLTVSPFFRAFHEPTRRVSNKTSAQNETFHLNLKDFTPTNTYSWEFAVTEDHRCRCMRYKSAYSLSICSVNQLDWRLPR